MALRGKEQSGKLGGTSVIESPTLVCGIVQDAGAQFTKVKAEPDYLRPENGIIK